MMEETIRVAINEVLSDLGETDLDFSVEHPQALSHGDYATNAALVLAQRQKKDPTEVAKALCSKIEGKVKEVERIEIAGPGFINFFLSRNFFKEKIAEARGSGDNWGKNTSLENEEILFEYTSPNLFKPLHVGNLVGNIVGESISRLFEYGGAIVRRLNYPSDIGLTVAKGVWGLQKTGGDPSDINAIGEAYRAGNEAYENDETAKGEIEAVNRALYAGDNEELNGLQERGIETSKHHI